MVKASLLLRTGDDLDIVDATLDATGMHVRLHRPGSEKQVVVNLRGTDLGLAKLMAVISGRFAASLKLLQDDAEEKRQAVWDEHVKSITGEGIEEDAPKADRKAKRPSR